MVQTQAICEFVFTDAEYRKGIVYYRELRSRHYSQWIWLAITVVFVLLVTDGLYVEYKNGELSDANGLKWGDILSAEAPFGIALVFQLLIYFTPFYGFVLQPFFYGSVNRNQNHLFRIGPDNFMEEMTDSTCSYQWSAFKSAREFPDGFILVLGKRHFYWLPKHGFASPQDIDLCRAFLHDHIKDFRALS